MLKGEDNNRLKTNMSIIYVCETRTKYKQNTK